MIAFVTKGEGFRGSVEYDFSPCKKTGKPRAEYVGGTLSGNPRQMAKMAAPIRSLREVANPVWRVSLNLDTKDGILPLRKWDEISNDFLIGMGLNPVMAAWCSIRHSDHHADPVPRDGVHITVLRVLPDGSLFNIENDVFRAIKVTKQLEEKYGLHFHNREPAERRAPSVAQTSATKRTGKMTAKETIQNKVDAFFSTETELTFENLKQSLLEKGVEIRDAKTQKGRLQGFSYFDQKSGVAVPGSKLGADYSLGMLARGLKYDQKDGLAETKSDSKMPAMLRPLILPEQYGAKQIRPHAAHQTEVSLDTSAFNNQVVNLNLGPASTAMLLIAGALTKASVYLVNLIIAFLKRLAAFFGFGVREAAQQSHQHPDPSAPAICYEPTQIAVLQAPKSAEDQMAQKMYEVAQALEQNDSSLLPVVEGAEKEREAVQAAMDDVGGKGGGATAETENFGITDEDFASTNAVSEPEPPKADPLDKLKEALTAHKTAARELELAEIKDGPIHFSTVNQRQTELKIVREDLDAAKSKWDEFCTQHALTWRLPSAEKTRLRQNFDNNLEAEKRAIKAVADAEAEDVRIEKLYASLPPAIVPVHIKQAEDQAIRAVTSARIALQREAEAAIKAIRSDIMMSPKMAKLESLLKASYSRFAIVGEITDSEFGMLQSQIEELRRLKAAQENARNAALAEHESEKDKPAIDGQTVK